LQSNVDIELETSGVEQLDELLQRGRAAYCVQCAIATSHIDGSAKIDNRRSYSPSQGKPPQETTIGADRVYVPVRTSCEDIAIRVDSWIRSWSNIEGAGNDRKFPPDATVGSQRVEIVAGFNVDCSRRADSNLPKHTSWILPAHSQAPVLSATRLLAHAMHHPAPSCGARSSGRGSR